MSRPASVTDADVLEALKAPGTTEAIARRLRADSTSAVKHRLVALAKRGDIAHIVVRTRLHRAGVAVWGLTAQDIAEAADALLAEAATKQSDPLLGTRRRTA